MAKSKKTEKNHPIAIIGGGPAGVSAAIAAAKKYKNIILYDKNPEPVKKLSSIGAIPLLSAEQMTSEKFIKAFGDRGGFIKPALKSFSWKELSKFFKDMGIKISSNGSNKLLISNDEVVRLKEVFKETVESAGIVYKKSSRVTALKISRGKVNGVIVNGITHPVSAVVLACGSFSFPKTGSTKDGYIMAEKAGHEIVPLKPAFVGLETKEKYGALLGDVHVRDCRINVLLKEEFQFFDRGTLTFTQYGLGGEIILNSSSKITELLEKGEVKIQIDQVPDMSKIAIAKLLNHEFPHTDRTTLFDHLNPYLPDGLLEAMEKLTRVHSSRPVTFLSALEKKHIVLWLKDFTFTIKCPRPFSETRGVLGGVALDDIDPETMGSKKIKNLYFAGELLDLLGPLGGYNIEMAFSTGHLAGLSASSGNGSKKK